jgi:hypothetical protein
MLCTSKAKHNFGVAEFGYEFVSRSRRRVAESKALKCLIFKFHTSIQQRHNFYGKSAQMEQVSSHLFTLK